MILISRHIVPKGYDGITLYPFIFLKENSLKNDKILVNHEKIHLQQQKELGVIFFFILYGLEYLFYFIKYKKHHKAYHAISFEREAYHHQKNIRYLSTRKSWSFRKYL